MEWIIAVLMAAVAQPSAPPEPVPTQHQPTNLDRLLDTKDYVTLGKTIQSVSRASDAKSDLDWLKARMMEGNSAFVTMLYSRLLWDVSANFPDEPKAELRQTAAMTTLYAYAAITVDGERCGDRSAVSHRTDQLMTGNPEIWPFIRSLSSEQREMIVKVAVMLETHTASRRDAIGDVEFLCRAGLEETAYNLRHGTAREVPTPAGGFGKTIELSGDGKYKPSERPEAEWRAAAEKRRSALAANLGGFVGAIVAATGDEKTIQ